MQTSDEAVTELPVSDAKDDLDTVETSQTTQAERQHAGAVDDGNDAEGQHDEDTPTNATADDTTLKIKERQERFKALQARAVRYASLIPDIP